MMVSLIDRDVGETVTMDNLSNRVLSGRRYASEAGEPSRAIIGVASPAQQAILTLLRATAIVLAGWYRVEARGIECHL